MCDTQCSVGLGITGGLIGIMMSIIFCNMMCSILLKPTDPILPYTRARTELPTTTPTVIEMPITIRIYLPQQDTTSMSLPPKQQGKTVFEPVPYASTQTTR
jgi:ABC-type antimicrobial peptide transport system permease subunit